MPNRIFKSRYPAWVRVSVKKDDKSIGQTSTTPPKDIYKSRSTGIYFVGAWKPYRANINQIKQKPDHGRRILRSPDRKAGIADILRSSSRVKEFKLKDAILYSYLRDTRFVLLICLLIGFALWCAIVPELIIEKPGVLCSPDIGLVVRSVRDTFLNNLCTEHQVPSPCECGEPLNKAVKHLFETKDKFDPLGINQDKVAGLAVFVAIIIISMTLAESVSEHGFRWS